MVSIIKINFKEIWTGHWPGKHLPKEHSFFLLLVLWVSVSGRKTVILVEISHQGVRKYKAGSHTILWWTMPNHIDRPQNQCNTRNLVNIPKGRTAWKDTFRVEKETWSLCPETLAPKIQGEGRAHEVHEITKVSSSNSPADHN